MKIRFLLLNEASDVGNGGGNPAPASPAMNAGQLAGFASGGPMVAPATQENPSATADVATPAAPSEFESFLASLGKTPEGAATASADAPAADTSKAGAESAAEQKAAFDFEKWYAEKFPENPDPTKIAKVEDWKGMRTTLNVALKDVQTLSGEKILLEQRLAAAEKAQQTAGNGAALPETEAVKKLQAELETNRLEMERIRQQNEGELTEYRNFKAAQDLAANPAFRAEYDGTRAAIKEEISGIVKEAGLDEKVVEAVLSAKSLLQIAKALESVDDPTIKSLIEQRAVKFADITAKREAALKGNPLQELAKWNDYAQTQQGMLAAKFTDSLKQQLVAAVPTVAGELTGENGNVFFKTPAGQAVLQQIGQRFEKGYDLSAPEVTTHMAKSAGFDFYAGFAQELMGKLAAAEAKLARYGAMDANQGGGAPPSGGTRTSGFDVASMFAGMRQ